MSKQYFKLNANCVPVSGIKDSAIFDLEKGDYYNISNTMYEVLSHNRKEILNLNSLKSKFDKGIDTFFHRLFKMGLGFYTQHPEYYPELNLEWDSPFEITTAIFEVVHENQNKVSEIVNILAKMGCPSMEFRIFSDLRKRDILDLLNLLHASRTRAITLLFENDTLISKEFCNQLQKILTRITNIYIFNTPKTNEHYKRLFPPFIDVLCTKKSISILNKNRITKQNFIVNIKAFCEAHRHNLSLNRTMCVDKSGNIKNHPLHKKIFGNIYEDDLLKVVKSEDFRLVWNISNEKINKCKACKFRYVCFNPGEIHQQGKNCYIRYQDCDLNYV